MGIRLGGEEVTNCTKAGGERGYLDKEGMAVGMLVTNRSIH